MTDPASSTDVEDVPLEVLSAKSSRRALRVSTIILAMLAFMAIAILSLLLVPGPLVAHWLSGVTQDPTTIRLSLMSAAQTVLFALGGFIALVGVALSLSRHRLELDTATLDRAKEDRRISELTQQRDIEAGRELRTRFTNAVALLSDPEKVTTRQAGVYALAALADDWLEFGRFDESQVCIDVLCGYLRSGWELDGIHTEGEKSIRAAGFDVIGAHLRATDDKPRWHGAHFNLRGAVLHFDVDMSEIEVREGTLVDLRGAHFVGGIIDFGGGLFSGGQLLFEEARFDGGLFQFNDAQFKNGKVSFDGAHFVGGMLEFNQAEFVGGLVSFETATFAGTEVYLFSAVFEGSTVIFTSAEFGRGTVMFANSTFSGGLVHFGGARFSGGHVGFNESQFSGSTISFEQAHFDGSTVSFWSTQFVDGIVNFDDTRFDAGAVWFDNASGNGSLVTFDNASFSGALNYAGEALERPLQWD